MQQQTKDEIEDFLLKVPEMTIEDFQLVDDTAIGQYEVRKEARPLVKLGAGDFNWLDKRVRDTIRPLMATLVWPHVGAASTAVNSIRVVRRTKIGSRPRKMS